MQYRDRPLPWMTAAAERSSRAVPGFDSPAVGFEAPFEMLGACHDRVRRSLALLARLVDHIDVRGHDEQSRAAARDVLRYFDLAAPHHHEDEERHVFPRLLAAGDAALAADVARLRADHAAMAHTWQPLRAVLEAWAGAEPPPLDETARRLAAAFAGLYAGHLALEDERVFPAARALCSAPDLEAMGREMADRRRA